MNHSTLGLGALAVLALLATPALADTPPLASASLTGFQIRLTDLDLSDGTPARLQLAPGHLGAYVGSVLLYEAGVDLGRPAAQSAISGVYSFSSTLTAGDPAMAGQGPGALASLTSARAGAGGSLYAEAAFIDGSFTLSAMSSVTFSGVGTASVLAPGDAWVSHAAAKIVATQWPGGDVMTVAQTVLGGFWGGAASSTVAPMSLGLTITNDSREDRQGHLYAGALAGQFVALSPVPEPATGALAATGALVVVLGRVLQRRRTGGSGLVGRARLRAAGRRP
jgi:hypothetical protein